MIGLRVDDRISVVVVRAIGECRKRHGRRERRSARNKRIIRRGSRLISNTRLGHGLCSLVGDCCRERCLTILLAQTRYSSSFRSGECECRFNLRLRFRLRLCCRATMRYRNGGNITYALRTDKELLVCRRILEFDAHRCIVRTRLGLHNTHLVGCTTLGAEVNRATERRLEGKVDCRNCTRKLRRTDIGHLAVVDLERTVIISANNPRTVLIGVIRRILIAQDCMRGLGVG